MSKASRLKSATGSRKSISVAQYSTHQQTIEDHKRKIIEAVNNLTEDELEKVSEMLRIAESLDSAEKPEAGEGDDEFEREAAEQEGEGQNQALDEVVV